MPEIPDEWGNSMERVYRLTITRCSADRRREVDDFEEKVDEISKQ